MDVNTIELSLKGYIEKCRSVFEEHQSKFSNVTILMRIKDPSIDDKQFFEKALKEAEQTDEFEAFVKALRIGPLAGDLQRLEVKKKRRRKKLEKKGKKAAKHFDIEKWSHNTARQAAKSFFRNTGTYFKLWKGHAVDKSNLIEILANYEVNSSELIRLFVFDGFVPFHERTMLGSRSLPVGELKKYTEGELQDLLRLPQTHWHHGVKPEIVKNAAIWHILTVREKVEYRGMTGIYLNDVLITPIDWADISEPSKREKDIELIGPVFLWFGEDANLAVEIRVRTNIFESFPVYQRVRNGYLPYEYDEEGNERPRRCVKYVGKNAIKLKKTFDIWREINKLDKEGFLRYPTETYVRTLMNLNSPTENLMEVLVGFITVIESLLTPESQQELAYKTALRGGSILTPDPEWRLRFYQELAGLYKIRSNIVHEGHIGKSDPNYYLRNKISPRLTEISRQIFLRYICLLHLGFQGILPEWVLQDRETLLSRRSRSNSIAGILDSIVLDPSLTKFLEEKMKKWDLYEDSIRKTGLHLKTASRRNAKH